MILFKTDITAFNLGTSEAHTITVNCEKQWIGSLGNLGVWKKRNEQGCGRNTWHRKLGSSK